ncbi:adipogenesis regulatory factor-like [Melanerpes formicivorus]|uniref:adipogenesis regulatory factor-like n=1 Tax=Melanerpes formicivorus TaxID=211600 RepID=UPI00358DD9DF
MASPCICPLTTGRSPALSIKSCTLLNIVTEPNLGIHSPILCGKRGLNTAMLGIGKKLVEEATQQAESAAQVAANTVGQTVQQAVEQAKDAGQKALDEVYKVAETSEKAVKNVANQATSWGKSFGQ